MGPFIPLLPFLSCKAAFKNNYLIVQEALQGATNYLFNSTVELNKTYILSNSTVGLISFTTSINIGKPTIQLGPSKTLHSNIAFNSTVESKHKF